MAKVSDMASNGAEEEAFWAEETATPPVLKEDRVSEHRVFDLQERTARFGEAIVGFAPRISQPAALGALFNRMGRLSK